jgi:hypothetical protein
MRQFEATTLPTGFELLLHLYFAFCNGTVIYSNYRIANGANQRGRGSGSPKPEQCQGREIRGKRGVDVGAGGKKSHMGAWTMASKPFTRPISI